jgi:hypothetical protein
LISCTYVLLPLLLLLPLPAIACCLVSHSIQLFTAAAEAESQTPD